MKLIELLPAEDEPIHFNPLYTGGLFHYYMLDESIFHIRVNGSILSFLLYFWWKILLANTVDPDQTPHHVASDMDLDCLPIHDSFTGFQVRMG